MVETNKAPARTAPAGTATAEREFTVSRLIDAPRELVWEAITRPEHVIHWWGPRGFSNTIHEMSVKPGGTWRFMMHGPDGVDYPNKIVFQEVVRPERLTYWHGDDSPDSPVHFEASIELTEESHKTRVTLTLLFESKAHRDMIVDQSGAVDGGKQTLQRLEEYVAMQPPADVFVISRTFDAPRDLVYKAWTEADRLAEWWGPRGFTVEVANLDLRPGGEFHYGLRSPGGQMMWGKWLFRDIAAPKRMVWITTFSDEEGGVTRHPASSTWPLEMLGAMTLAEKDGKTTITIRTVAHAASAEERATFASSFASMEGGFGGTFDQLAQYLKTAKP
jgi:uncharacterized protein YndB with AHSA1/START domain